MYFLLLQSPTSLLMPHKADRAADMHRENIKKKRREMEQASMDATSDLLDTDSNATFAMVSSINFLIDDDSDKSFWLFSLEATGKTSRWSLSTREAEAMWSSHGST